MERFAVNGTVSWSAYRKRHVDTRNFQTVDFRIAVFLV